MVWKKINKPEEDYISKRAVSKKFSPMFSKAHTRKAKELNLAKNCKKTVEKKLTKSQSKSYNFILDQQRMKDNPNAKS